MHLDSHAHSESQCSEGCCGCSGHDHSMPEDTGAGLSGGSLAMAAVGAFLLPLLLAIIGSAWVLPGLGGAILGLGVGVVLALGLGRWFAGSAGKSQEQDQS